MFKVWFTNHMYYADCSFATAREALAFMRQHGFESAAHLKDYGVVFAWSPLYGLRTYHGAYDYLYSVEQ